MIGNPLWFQRRKYGGWGITPRTWQGWVYIVMILFPFAVFQAMPIWDNDTRLVVTGLWLLFMAIDITHIMVKLKKDEREKKIESLAERNAAWAMVAVVTIAVGYEAARSAVLGRFEVDPFLIAALFAGLIAKSLTNFYYERKGIQ